MIGVTPPWLPRQGLGRYYALNYPQPNLPDGLQSGLERLSDRAFALITASGTLVAREGLRPNRSSQETSSRDAMPSVLCFAQIALKGTLSKSSLLLFLYSF